MPCCDQVRNRIVESSGPIHEKATWVAGYERSTVCRYAVSTCTERASVIVILIVAAGAVHAGTSAVIEIATTMARRKRPVRMERSMVWEAIYIRRRRRTRRAWLAGVTLL